MKTAAVIAEFNPFHNGHKYIADEARRITGADTVIALMSGYFVQRGEPAIFSRSERTNAALTSYDAVFELPFVYSSASAGEFASGAIKLLDHLGNIDYLCFGAETDDSDLLCSIADIIAFEPYNYSDIIKNEMRTGSSFPSARSKAISSIISKNDPKLKPQHVSDILSKPNNILGAEYLSALKRSGSRIAPVIIKRSASNDLTSAHHLRHLLYNDNDAAKYMPYAFRSSSAIFPDDISEMLSYRLTADDHLDSYFGISEELSSRIKAIGPNHTFSDLKASLKTKNIALTGISRGLLHALLGYTDEMHDIIFGPGPNRPYINLLGMKRKASGFIRSIDNNRIDVINKKSKYIAPDPASDIMRSLDIKASDIYNLLYFKKTGETLPNELSSQVIISDN